MPTVIFVEENITWEIRGVLSVPIQNASPKGGCFGTGERAPILDTPPHACKGRGIQNGDQMKRRENIMARKKEPIPLLSEEENAQVQHLLENYQQIAHTLHQSSDQAHIENALSRHQRTVRTGTSCAAQSISEGKYNRCRRYSDRGQYCKSAKRGSQRSSSFAYSPGKLKNLSSMDSTSCLRSCYTGQCRTSTALLERSCYAGAEKRASCSYCSPGNRDTTTGMLV